jgi:ketosteroid isomerase-like protein
MPMKNWGAGLGLLVMLAPGAAFAAGLPAQDATYRAIAAADAGLFGAVNRCAMEAVADYFADDVEFYHDVGGLDPDKATVVRKIREAFCGNKMSRELVPGSLEVHPVPGFGAIQLGTHRFLHPAEPNNIGEAKFIHVWRLQNGAWKLARVLSFDH